jgi:voltage-gated potassium channel
VTVIDIPPKQPTFRVVLRVVDRSVSRFMRAPATITTAARAIVAVTSATVAVSAIAMWLFDHREFPSIWLGLWWAVQTVTTVGYGDVTPHAVAGRIVATVVMIEGVAFLAIVTAAVTSTLVARAERDRGANTVEQRSRELVEIIDRLERIETKLGAFPPADD